MDRSLELADQRLYPSPGEGGGRPSVMANVAPPSGAGFAADLPALLLAVLPLIQAIDWLETASAATLETLSEVAIGPGELTMVPSPSLANELAIERALEAIQAPERATGGSALVYAADIEPLSLTIDSSDLFADAGALAEVTPRLTAASFVENVENDIFGRELNVAATPMAAPGKSNPGSVTNIPIESEAASEASSESTGDNLALNKPNGGQTNYHPNGDGGGSGILPPEDSPGETETFTVVDLTLSPPGKSDILP
jgi:hypothetical protein